MSELKPQLKPVAWLKPYAANAKIHDDKQVAKIRQSIDKFGWTTAIVTEADGTIIAGHGRRLAALIEPPLSHVPVVIRDDLTPEEAKALRLADNRVAISEIDARLLQEELASLEVSLEGIFDDKELDFMKADLGEINDAPFVEDLEAVVRDAAVSAAKSVETTDARDVKLEKVFGFRSIAGRDEKHLARFLATIEEQTGLTGAQALVEHAKAVCAAA
ncbi:ParB/Srx family N-terminal domain-containing protein [Paraburkholderia sp.]|uniref:ParB/Srx family N-terminal domain-containing protein n=1 Tax=Paraburkholderia sp. TaxID=1926495 RepID=UPI0039E3BB38